MTPKQQVKALLKKLANPYWTPVPTDRYLTDYQGNVIQFNLYFVLRGRPHSHQPGDIKKNIEIWKLAGSILSRTTPQGPVADSAAVLSPSEFWLHMVKPNTTLFTTHIPITEWQRLLNENTVDSTPVRHTYRSSSESRQQNK